VFVAGVVFVVAVTIGIIICYRSRSGSDRSRSPCR
jgi:hypothetical protein